MPNVRYSLSSDWDAPAGSWFWIVVVAGTDGILPTPFVPQSTQRIRNTAVKQPIYTDANATHGAKTFCESYETLNSERAETPSPSVIKHGFSPTNLLHKYSRNLLLAQDNTNRITATSVQHFWPPALHSYSTFNNLHPLVTDLCFRIFTSTFAVSAEELFFHFRWRVGHGTASPSVVTYPNLNPELFSHIRFG